MQYINIMMYITFIYVLHILDKVIFVSYRKWEVLINCCGVGLLGEGWWQVISIINCYQHKCACGKCRRAVILKPKVYWSCLICIHCMCCNFLCITLFQKCDLPTYLCPDRQIEIPFTNIIIKTFPEHQNSSTTSRT